MACPECQHVSHEHLWFAATDERSGWRCCECSSDLGFRPDLDRDCLESKVSAILHHAHDSNLIYISNGTEGDIVAMNTVRHIQDQGLGNDQYTILSVILRDPNLANHAKYWADQAKEWFAARGEGPGIPEDQKMRAAGAPSFLDLVDSMVERQHDSSA